MDLKLWLEEVCSCFDFGLIDLCVKDASPSPKYWS